jgi:hypothetical protein
VKRLVGVWERNGSTSSPAPWQLHDYYYYYYYYYYYAMSVCCSLWILILYMDHQINGNSRFNSHCYKHWKWSQTATSDLMTHASPTVNSQNVMRITHNSHNLSCRLDNVSHYLSHNLRYQRS